VVYCHLGILGFLLSWLAYKGDFNRDS
jgi:hypothetical protein